ncbi:MmgE/PrpD family protein [Bradyrhizobium sp. HKCCYLS20291]|uniref:MmgE/PrpD family protein n=1 Tax=Bradyrhizobium sp. HKCCYLS20291 TaxID=3420766 RepID=UPI003EBC0A91
MSANPQATKALSHWAATVPARWAPSTIRIAEHSLEDTIAAMVAGAGDRVSASVRQGLESGAGTIPVIGSTKRLCAPLSALANGTAAHARELDEMFFVAGSHFGCALIPAILALACEMDTSLDQVLDSLIVGSEVMARIGMAMNRAHFEKGWHGTQTIGVIAAAAACARLRGLDTDKMTHALSLAVSMAAGPKVQFGTDAKPLHAGLAAQGGVLAASLAAAGVRGSEVALEGPHGFGALYGGHTMADWSAVANVQDEPLAIERHGFAFKLYPNCASTHRCLDALQSLAAEHRFDADEVAHVETLVGRVNMVNLMHSEPGDPREAMFSMQYAIATMLRYGGVELADFTPQAVRDAETRRHMQIVEMRLDPKAERGAETATNLLPHTTIVTLKDGRRLARSLQHAKGSLLNPFSASERQTKFDQCTAGIAPAERLMQVRQILSAPHGIKVRRLLELLQFEAHVDDGERFQRTTGCISKAPSALSR